MRVVLQPCGMAWASRYFKIVLGKSPKVRTQKKKLQTRFGKIEVGKDHILSESPTSMNISSYAQETMCYIGQHLVFKEAEEVINSLTGADFNAKQIERVCHQYGSYLEEENLRDTSRKL